MARNYAKIAYTNSVKKAQEGAGVRELAERMGALEIDDDRLGPREAAFIGARDGFYVASVGEGGWPYVQYRGGPAGFLKVLDDRTLAYADFRGNRQYLTVGNVTHDDRVSLFLMDYPNRRRLKIFARAEVLDAEQDQELLKQLVDRHYAAVVERAVVFHLVAFDWNCPQHITPRFTLQEHADRGALSLSPHADL